MFSPESAANIPRAVCVRRAAGGAAPGRNGPDRAPEPLAQAVDELLAVDRIDNGLSTIWPLADEQGTVRKKSTRIAWGDKRGT